MVVWSESACWPWCSGYWGGDGYGQASAVLVHRRHPVLFAQSHVGMVGDADSMVMHFVLVARHCLILGSFLVTRGTAETRMPAASCPIRHYPVWRPFQRRPRPGNGEGFG